MGEIVKSPTNSNNLIYGTGYPKPANIGPSCVDGKGEEVTEIEFKSDEAPILAVRER